MAIRHKSVETKFMEERDAVLRGAEQGWTAARS